jgi:hypothetical protein
MIGTLLGLFEREEFYPDNFADHKLNRNVLYHEVNKYFLIGLMSYMVPLKAFVISNSKIDKNKWLTSYLDFSKSNIILLAKSKQSNWIFFFMKEENTGSVGKIDCNLMTEKELETMLINHVRKFTLGNIDRECLAISLSEKTMRFI